jgi:hypothetical protein
VTGSQHRAASTALLPGAVAAGLLLLVWVATSGPAQIIGPSHQIPVVPSHRPQASVSPQTQPPLSGRELFKHVHQKYDLHWIGDLLAWALVLSVVVVVLLALRWAWSNRWHRPAPVEATDFDVLPSVDAVSAVVSDDAAAQLDAVERGSPRNGIVACWVRLEEATAAAGVPRAEWETSAEFTVRVLTRLDVDPRSVGTLARLYREARFSEHELGEQERARARSALEQLHRDLRESAGSRGCGPEPAPTEEPSR